MFFGDRPLRKSLADKSRFFRSILNPARLQQNNPAVRPAIANVSDNQPEADQMPLPVLPAKAISEAAIPNLGASGHAAAPLISDSVSNIILFPLSFGGAAQRSGCS